MAIEFQLLPDGTYQEVSVAETYTAAEFAVYYDRVVNRKATVEANIAALVPLEVPPGSSDEIAQAIAEYNVTYYTDRLARLQEKLDLINTELALLDNVVVL
jgi:hypothetical protein